MYLVTLVIVSLLLAVTISTDVRDGITEDALLNHGLAQLGPKKNLTQLAAVLVRFSLRVRQLVLPWLSVGATATTLITNPNHTQ